MIVETRELFFTNSALKKTIAWYHKAPNQTDLPLGVVTTVMPTSDGGLSVQIQQSGASRSREVVFTPSKTLALLLLFCRRQKVPIPRDADKEIEAADDGLILIVRGETQTFAPPP